MDSKQAKRFKWFSRVWNVMSLIAVVWGIITAVSTAFILYKGGWAASVPGLFLVAVAIRLIALTRFVAKDAKESSQQFQQPTK